VALPGLKALLVTTPLIDAPEDANVFELPPPHPARTATTAASAASDKLKVFLFVAATSNPYKKVVRYSLFLNIWKRRILTVFEGIVYERLMTLTAYNMLELLIVNIYRLAGHCGVESVTREVRRYLTAQEKGSRFLATPCLYCFILVASP
jgi:hypothetical protein